MAFTVTSPFYDEDERRRKAAAELAEAGNAGAKGILSGLEYADKDKKYQAELRFKQAGDDRDAKRLVLQANADARAAEGDKRDAEEHAATLRFRESEQTRKAREAERARTAELLAAQVASSVASGGEQEEPEPAMGSIAGMEVPIEPISDGKSSAQRLASRLRDTPEFNGLTEAEIVAEYERQTGAKMDKSAAANVAERKLVDDEKTAAAQRAEIYSRIEDRKNKPPASAKQGKPSERERTGERQRSMAKNLLGQIETSLKAYEGATGGEPTGRIEAPLRRGATGIVPGFNESERAAFLANAEALNAMLFPILGRPDAPADAEVKRLAPLRINEDDSAVQIRSKLATLAQMIAAQEPADPEVAAMSDEDLDAAIAAAGGT
jgi:hypothetical protein